MTSRRRGLLLVLIPLVGLPLTGLASLGTVEVTLWLLLLVAWLWAFFGWGSRRSGRAPAH